LGFAASLGGEFQLLSTRYRRAMAKFSLPHPAPRSVFRKQTELNFRPFFSPRFSPTFSSLFSCFFWFNSTRNSFLMISFSSFFSILQRGSDELLSQTAVMAPAADNNNQDLATKKAKLDSNSVIGSVGEYSSG
jgi:hypothetical protein